jgi:hypothetical protein
MPMTHVNSFADTMSKAARSTRSSSQKTTPMSTSELEILSDAARVGYLVFPSKDFLWKLFRMQNTRQLQLFENKLKMSDAGADKLNRLSAKSSRTQRSKAYYDFSLIKYLNLSYSHINEIGDIHMCHNIQILLLSENYLARIEPLINCVNLVRLDLHKNQASAQNHLFL